MIASLIIVTRRWSGDFASTAVSFYRKSENRLRETERRSLAGKPGEKKQHKKANGDNGLTTYINVS